MAYLDLSMLKQVVCHIGDLPDHLLYAIETFIPYG